MMKRLSSLFNLMPLLVAYLLLATKGTGAQESHMREKDRRIGIKHGTNAQDFLGGLENRINSSRRRLHNSNKNTSTHTFNLWHGGGDYNSKAAKKHSKSQKSGKSKSGKSNTNKIPTEPWMGVRQPTRKPTRRPGKPIRKPTPKPSSVTPPTPPPPEDKFVEITMGGVLTANNLEPVPPSGSDQMKELAQIFEETILSSLSSLEDEYKCIVYDIGGDPVHIGGVRSDVIFNRRLQGQSQVRYTLRVTKPCSGCDKGEAMNLGSNVFAQTFQILDASAKSGDMTTTFCSKAEGTGVVPSPCQVTITSAEGSSLDVKFVDDMTTPKPTTPSPTFNPTTRQPVKWGDTPFPTLNPVTSPPTVTGGTDMTTTFCSKAEGTGVVPSPCQVTITSAEGSSLDVKFVDDMTTPKPTTPSPTFNPTTRQPVKWGDTPFPTLNPVTSPPTVTGGTAPPTNGTAAPSTPGPMIMPSTLSPVDVPATIAPTKLLRPTDKPSITPAPSIASVPLTIAPTSIPVGALYYTGFETGKFPNDSYWTTTESTPWIIDTERVHGGVYSIRSPILENEELTPRESSVTFTTGDDWPAGNLVLSMLVGTQMPFDDVQYFVDDVYRGQLEGTSDFKRISVVVGPGKHEVVFTYQFNPVDLPAFPPKGDYEHIGAVYIDDVYFLPMGVSMAPTTAKTSVQPTAINPQTGAPVRSLCLSVSYVLLLNIITNSQACL